jgi:hypothetical protein
MGLEYFFFHAPLERSDLQAKQKRLIVDTNDIRSKQERKKLCSLLHINNVSVRDTSSLFAALWAAKVRAQ